eukprot:gnl/Trimastix_PCT/1324.p1 GENE.gnl/Trimastix_PCT/1324~~gnl/Trimastix_PCT/1324.p1  ORF type:complete len:233 (-),score=18.16 gnl/Trimastix_PCT/1324:141-839(-)
MSNGALYRGVIFDLDGTLADSEPCWLSAEEAICKRRNRAYDHSKVKHLVGIASDQFAVAFKDIFGLDDAPEDITRELHSRMLEAVRNGVVSERAGATQLIQAVHSTGAPMWVASSSPLSLIDATLNTFKWASLFRGFSSGESERRGKPAPDVYLTAVRSVGLEPHECIAIEDSLNGVRSAIAAGLTCIAVPHFEIHPRELFEDLTPHIFGSLQEARAFLLPLLQGDPITTVN